MSAPPSSPRRTAAGPGRRAVGAGLTEHAGMQASNTGHPAHGGGHHVRRLRRRCHVWTGSGGGGGVGHCTRAGAGSVSESSLPSSRKMSCTMMLTSVTCSPVIRSTAVITLRRIPVARSAIATP